MNFEAEREGIWKLLVADRHKMPVSSIILNGEEASQFSPYERVDKTKQNIFNITDN